MKSFVRSVPANLFLSGACLSLIALGGCSSSGSSSGTPSGPAGAKSIYAIQHSQNDGTEQDSVVVFSASATGSTTPSSTLMLPSNVIGVSLAVGPQGQIYVGGIDFDNQVAVGALLEYSANASGSATPTVTLYGSNSEGTTFIFPENIAVNSANTLFVSSPDGTLESFASGFTASSTPTQYLTWGTNYFDDTGSPMGVDTAGDIFYLDPDNQVIDVFGANATGTTGPVRTITGTNTMSFDELENIAVDGAGDVYVTNYNYTDDPASNSVATNPGSYGANKSAFASLLAMGHQRSASRLKAHPNENPANIEPTEIIEFAAGASGNATPTKRIGGSGATTNLTNIVEPLGLAVDAASNLYYADANGSYDSDNSASILLEVFTPSATGNVAPAASITSSSFTYSDAVPFNSGQVAIH